jgi:sugar phosphate isomerase/epimerase
VIKVAVVTDEISSDLETALEIATDWGMKTIELRGVGNQRVGSLSPYWEDHVIKMVRNFSVKVAALSPGVFKIPLPAPVFEGHTVLKWQDEAEYYNAQAQAQTVERHLNEILPATIRLAKKLDVPNILIFSFNKPEGTAGDGPPLVIDYLKKAARMAGEAGITLILENEHICWGDTAKNTRKIIEQVGSKHLKLNWDPGNAYFAQEVPYPDGYETIKDIIGHVHMKDAITDRESGAMQYVVAGEIDWEGQLKALREDGYHGYLSIETHCRPKIASAKRTLERIIAVLGKEVL